MNSFRILSKPRELRRITLSVRQTIFASFAVTLIFAALVSHFLTSTLIRETLRFVRQEKLAADPQDTVSAIAGHLPDIPESELSFEAARIVAATGPIRLLPVLATLLGKETSAKARKFAVLLIEQGALRYRTPSYLNQAGYQYYTGVNITRDYEKTVKFLSDPVLADSPASNFYLGMALMATDNPHGDIPSGLALIRKAASAGFAPAERILESQH